MDLDDNYINFDDYQFDEMNITNKLLVGDTDISTGWEEKEKEDFLAHKLGQTFNEMNFSYIFITLLSLFGLLSNCILLLINGRLVTSRLQNHIISIALANLLLLSSSPLPMAVYFGTTDDVNYCKISEFVKNFCNGVIVYSLSIQNINICIQKKYETKFQNTFSSDLLIWLSAFIATIPNILPTNIEEVTYNWENTNFCSQYPDYNFSTTYKIFNTVSNSLLYFFLPFSIFIFCQASILFRNKIDSYIFSAEEFQNPDLSPNKMATTYIVRYSSLVYFVHMFPFVLFGLWYNLNSSAEEDYNENWHRLRTLGYFTSFLHPWAYPVLIFMIKKKCDIPYDKKYINVHI